MAHPIIARRVNTIGRGYVVVRDGNRVSAVVSGPDARNLQRRFGGRIVNVKGHAFRYHQNRSLRVLVDPSFLF